MIHADGIFSRDLNDSCSFIEFAILLVVYTWGDSGANKSDLIFARSLFRTLWALESPLVYTTIVPLKYEKNSRIVHYQKFNKGRKFLY